MPSSSEHDDIYWTKLGWFNFDNIFISFFLSGVFFKFIFFRQYILLSIFDLILYLIDFNQPY